jgi:hypothetical protein
MFSLRKEVHNFMESKEKSVHEFQDPQWMCDFGFLVDFNGHLNELNCCLQAKDKFTHTLYDPSKVSR